MIFDTYPRLESGTLILRRPTEADIPALERMLGEEEVYRYEPTYLPELQAGSAGEFLRGGCDRLFRGRVCIILGIYTKQDPDRFLGIAELYGYSAEREKVSIGYRLRKEVWHRGIATEVAAMLKEYILNGLRLRRITAHVLVGNTASEKCLLKNGFYQRRPVHDEDWGFGAPVQANKFAIYPDETKPEELLFLAPDPAVLPLYHEFVMKLRNMYPGIETKVQKTQISFSNRHIFACISFLRAKKKADLPPHFLTLTLGLPFPLDSERAAAKTEPYPGRWTTHIVLGGENELNDELFGWIDAAYRFAGEKS